MFPEWLMLGGTSCGGYNGQSALQTMHSALVIAHRRNISYLFSAENFI